MKKKTRCKKCNKLGHSHRECPDKKKKESSTAQTWFVHDFTVNETDDVRGVTEILSDVDMDAPILISEEQVELVAEAIRRANPDPPSS